MQFITHYPEVAQLATEMPDRVTAGYMDCIERRGFDDDGEEGEEERERGEGEKEKEEGRNSSSPSAAPSVPHITFLYKLVRGVAKRSFGLNVARLAGLPERIVSSAARHAADLEAGRGLLPAVVVDDEEEEDEGGRRRDGGQATSTAAAKATTAAARRVAQAASAAVASGDDAALLAAVREAKEALE